MPADAMHTLYLQWCIALALATFIHWCCIWWHKDGVIRSVRFMLGFSGILALLWFGVLIMVTDKDLWLDFILCITPTIGYAYTFTLYLHYHDVLMSAHELPLTTLEIVIENEKFQTQLQLLKS